MATASASNTPECSICFGSFEKPKILPCGHTFCLWCIERFIADKTKTFPCPICNQDIRIPKRGAKMFTTNIILQTFQHTTQVKDQHPTTTQPRCPNHNQRGVDYYCNNCNVGLCFRCIFKQHKYHETLDIECDETRNKTIEKLERSHKIIRNRIKNLEKSRSTLLESFEKVKTLCEDSCAKVTAKTEKIVSDVRQRCEQIIKDIRKNLEENRCRVEDREKEITKEINKLESNIESNIRPSAKTTLNILRTLVEIETLGESKDYNLCLQYLQWVGNDFSLDIGQLGSVISKSSYLLGSYQFLFNVNDIKKGRTNYYSKNTFHYNNLVWSGVVKRTDDYSNSFIGIKLLPDDNPKLNHCIADYQLSLLNIEDSKTRRVTFNEMRFDKDRGWGKMYFISWSEITDKNNGYLNSDGQLVIKCDITQLIEISWK